MAILKGHLGFKGEKGDTGEVGTPKVYRKLFRELQVDNEVNPDFHYIILCEADKTYYGHWVYFDQDFSAWRDGGLYGSVVSGSGSGATVPSVPTTPSLMRCLQKSFRISSENVLSFSLPRGFTKGNLVFVFVNGRKLPLDEYSIVGSQVILKEALNVLDTSVELIVFCDTEVK